VSTSTDMSIPVAYLTSDRTSGASPTSGAAGAPARDRLDNQGFLKLLIAQLANQDPSSPTDSTTILTQTTQLAQMESLEEQISTARESFALQMRGTAASLVGRSVGWTDATGADRSGVVTAVSYAGAVPTLTVGDDELSLDAVRTLSQAG